MDRKLKENPPNKKHSFEWVHGESSTPLYRIWKKFRTNRHHRIFPDWEVYVKFRDWALENGYVDHKVMLRRKNRSLGYNPSNCYWLLKRGGITAFGETKNLMEWVRDERCGVSHMELLRRRLDRGLDPELAISYVRVMHRTPKSRKGRPRTRGLRRVWKNIENDFIGWRDYHDFERWVKEAGWGIGKRLAKINHWKEWGPKNTQVVHKSVSFFYQGFDKHLIKSWGVRKTITEWLQDVRCRCNCREILEDRLKKGWNPEYAISIHPFWKRKLNRNYKLINSDGIERSIYWWSRTKSCKVEFRTLMERLRKGVPLDEALWMVRIPRKKKRWSRVPNTKKRWTYIRY